jgi:hypothetical protein
MRWVGNSPQHCEESLDVQTLIQFFPSVPSDIVGPVVEKTWKQPGTGPSDRRHMAAARGRDTRFGLIDL